jgi:hypothetical protein
MAVDKGYGSGKPRSAANSAARRRAAEGKMTKSKKGVVSQIKAGRAKQAASPLGQLADTVLGFALPVGKVKAAATALRAAGKTSQAAALSARVLAKEGGRNLPKTINEAKRMFTGIPESYTPKTASKVLQGGLSRDASTSVFPRSPKSNVSEGTLNIVDTRRMNPAQAKSALEGGVSQTAKIKRRVPSAPKSVNKVTKRLLGGR